MVSMRNKKNHPSITIKYFHLSRAPGPGHTPVTIFNGKSFPSPSNCILGKAYERQSPSLSFRCLSFTVSKKVSFYCLVDIVFQSPAGSNRIRTCDLLHHNRVALTTGPLLITRKDGWMTYDFTSFSTVFQSYRGDGR